MEKGLLLAIVQREELDLLGHLECDWSWDPHCPSLSVVIDPVHQRRGYGSEAFRMVLRFVFENTPAHVTSCWIANWNKGALHFVASHGFQQTGRMRRAGIHQGKYYDVIVADLLRSEWQQLGGRAHAS